MIRTTQNTHEPPLQASKWLKCPVLLSADEMARLLQTLSPLDIFITGSVTKIGCGHISQEEFLQSYREYATLLSQGLLPEEAHYRSIFSSVFTTTPDAVYALLLEEDQQLIRLSKPVIQLQSHRLHFSHDDNTFRSMTFGSDSILWGIQFSYPQLCQDAQTKEILPVDLRPEFPNTQLFKTLQRWVRDNTIPTPFIVNGQKINSPVRLGKECLPWINKHPQLIQKGFQIAL